jgi:uncharacterized membrane protein
VSLMPFSTSVIGEHGNLPAAAVLYAANMLAITVFGALRTRELLHQPQVHSEPIEAGTLDRLKTRAYALPACAMVAVVLGFFLPAWNMLAMVPMVMVPTLARS